MAGGNLSPRQKMINMMYLVLTALLALNVSAEILKAFHLVEVSLDKSSDNVNIKNTTIMEGITKYHKDFPEDANGTMVFTNATKARQIAGELVNYIGDLKNQVVAGAEGRKEDSNGDGKIDDEEIVKADDTEKHANLMINNKKGEELRGKINAAREALIALVPKDEQDKIQSDLVTDDVKEKGEMKKWESVFFEHTPAAAVVTLLTKLQNDTRNTEAQVLEILRGKLTSDIVVVENFTAKVIPNNGTYITQGGKYSADIFLAAQTRQEANITVNGTPLTATDGVGKYEVVASGEGEKKYKAVIKTKRSTGKEEVYEVEGSYFVLKPLAVISADAMNVVYVGLENPISVSVPGYSANDVNVTATGATLKPGQVRGTFTLSVPSGTREVVVSASVKDKATNATKKMGEQKYRVKGVPSPSIQLGTLKNGNHPAAVVKNQQFVLSALENFAYEGIKYSVTEFKLGYMPKVGKPDEKKASGQALTPEMKSLLSKIQSGDKVMIYGVKAKGPNGVVPVTSSLIIQVN